MTKRDEENESLMKQMEALNGENNDLQQQISTLENSIIPMQDERNKLQDSLQETSALCLEMEGKLSSYKREKDELVETYTSKLDDMQKLLAGNTTEKEKAAKGHQEIVDGLQAHISDQTVQISKLIDQLSTASNEKSTLTTRLETVSSELSYVKDTAEAQATKIAQLDSSIETLTAERDMANVRVTDLASGNESVGRILAELQSEKKQLSSIAEERAKTIAGLEAEKEHAVANARSLESTINELQEKARSQEAALDASKSDLDTLKARIEEANKQCAQVNEEKNALALAADGHNETIARLKADKASALESVRTLEAEKVETLDKVKSLEVNIEKLHNSKSDSPATSPNDELHAKIQSLQSQVDELEVANTQLKEEVAANESRNQSALPQSTDEVKLEEVKKLNDELRDLRDNNVLLQEAVQDIQVDKEDLQLENEELASKLTDLTTQAKKMLLNNESLEEAINDQQIEYEDRLAELEAKLEEQLRNDKDCISDLEDQLEDIVQDDDNMATLQQKHKVSLETIVRLKAQLKDVTRLEEENLELRRRIDHCTSENDAAKEIKSIVQELKAKNEEISEALHVSREQNDAAADIIENLKADNDRLWKDIVAMQADGPKTDDDCNLSEDRAGDHSEIDSELQHSTERALVTVDGNIDEQRHLNGTGISQEMTVATEPPDVVRSSSEVEDKIQTLTIENGQLAQRLGNAVADKECE